MDEERVRVTSEVFLVKATNVGKSSLEQLDLMRGEIVLRFDFQHFEAIENGLGGSEIDAFLPRGRMGNL
ncbi:MAG: hypothetical protein RI957_270, partial [Verrucomicrobiota bacterium]